MVHKSGSALISAATLLCAACATGSASMTPEHVLAIDEQQRDMVLRSDVSGLDRLAHRNLMINAPAGRVLLREQFLANMRSGEIAAEAFSRTPEEVRISGGLAVVMGNESFTPAASSEHGRTYGARQLRRRYTNVYVWEDGRWQWVARHANVLPTPSQNE